MTEQDEMLTLIIDEQDKAALDDYADARGIKLDRRKGFDKMLADFQSEIAANAPPITTDTAVEPASVPEDVPEDAQPAATLAPEPVSELVASSEPELEPEADEDLETANEPAPVTASAVSLINAYANQWASTVAKDVLSVTPVVDGTELTVTIVTRHGVTTRSTFLEGGEVSDIEAAFADIARQIG